MIVAVIRCHCGQTNSFSEEYWKLHGKSKAWLESWSTKDRLNSDKFIHIWWNVDMMMLFGFSSNGSSTDVFHFNIDSIIFYPRHSFLSPSFVPSSAFASPERVNSHLHFAKKCLQKSNFPSCPSQKQKTGHQQINKLEKRCPKKINCWMDPTVQSSKRPSASPLFSPSLLSPSLGSSSCSHKATWLKLIEKFKQLYV